MTKDEFLDKAFESINRMDQLDEELQKQKNNLNCVAHNIQSVDITPYFFSEYQNKSEIILENLKLQNLEAMKLVQLHRDWEAQS